MAKEALTDLERLRDAYERQQNNDEVPNLQELAGQISNADRHSLIRQLVEAEIDASKSRNIQLSADDLLVRFPSDQATVSFALRGSAESKSDSAHDSGVGKLSSYKGSIRAGSSLGGYRIIGEIGRGGMGVVYRAQSETGGGDIALKALPISDAERLHKFKREFRLLSEISHPNLVDLYSLESVEDTWFITMELVNHTVDFRSFVRPGGRFVEARLRNVLPQLLDAIAFLHQKQIVHRDLKPSNVLVTDAGRLVVLDFGLVGNLGSKRVVSETGLSGTPAYMAPETIRGDPETAAADWYALGVMLFEALAGHLPFEGGTWEILNAKCCQDAEFSSVDEGVPEDLRMIALQLLSRDPGQRTQANELCLTSGTAQAERHSENPQTDLASTAPVIIGREKQLGLLQEEFQTFEASRKAKVVFVKGRSGEGKSFLVERFLAPVQKRDDIVVISGRCYERESVPFKAIDSVIDGLSSFLRRLPSDRAASLLPREASLLCRTFPAMNRVKVIADMPKTIVDGLDDQQIQSRAFAALRELLSRLGDRYPILFVIDDLQWGDDDSAHLLMEVLKQPRSPAVMLLGTYRTDEATQSKFLQRWQSLGNQANALTPVGIDVGALSLYECKVMLLSCVRTMDAEASRSLAETLYEQTGGNPFLLADALAMLTEMDTDLARFSLNDSINHRLAFLSISARGALDIIAVAGNALSVSDLKSVLQRDGDLRPADLDGLRKQRLIRFSTGEDPRVDTYHDKIRSSVLEFLQPIRKRQLHLNLALEIEDRAEVKFDDFVRRVDWAGRGDQAEYEQLPLVDRAHDLAYHFDAAGGKQRGAIYGLVAAEQSSAQASPSSAAAFYQIANANAGAVSQSIRHRIEEGRARNLLLMGSYEGAKELLSTRELSAEDSISKARNFALLGELLHKTGHLNESINQYEIALRELGVRIPKSISGFLVGVHWEGIRQGIHLLIPASKHRRAPTPKETLTNHIFNRVTPVYGFRNMLEMLWGMLAGMNRAEKYPPSKQLAFNYAIQGGLVTMFGLYAWAEKYTGKSIRIREGLNDQWGIGHSLSWRGIGLYAAGEYDKAVDCLSRATKAFEETGDLWEQNMARFHHACSLYRLGEIPAATELAKENFQASLRIGDTRTHCSLLAWSNCTQGKLDFERLASQFEPAVEEIMPTCNLGVGRARWLIAEGDLAAAIDLLEESWKAAKRNFLVNFHTVGSLTWLITAYRLQAEALTPSLPDQAASCLKKAKHYARTGQWLTRVFKLDRPHVLREVSLLYLAENSTRKARVYAERSSQLADKQGAKYEKLQSNSVLGRAKVKEQASQENVEFLDQATRELNEYRFSLEID